MVRVYLIDPSLLLYSLECIPFVLFGQIFVDIGKFIFQLSILECLSFEIVKDLSLEHLARTHVEIL